MGFTIEIGSKQNHQSPVLNASPFQSLSVFPYPLNGDKIGKAMSENIYILLNARPLYVCLSVSIIPTEADVWN